MNTVLFVAAMLTQLGGPARCEAGWRMQPTDSCQWSGARGLIELSVSPGQIAFSANVDGCRASVTEPAPSAGVENDQDGSFLASAVTPTNSVESGFEWAYRGDTLVLRLGGSDANMLRARYDGGRWVLKSVPGL